ncbi:MAG: CBS domain-containing protein [Deltaproteobacteria bacterium]|nr:CBS domain-containing protein [Candidatus Anaeroferrophillus wilburensis]MBN2888200.1 CBS domain-containing protein [Deltaproteobacteria bacterium]
MDVIITHLNADFDGLASMLAARLLYPDAVMVFPGSQEKSIRNFFLHSCTYAYPFKSLKEVDLSQVTRLIIVDTRQRERIGAFIDLLDKPGMEICLYDHHPDSPGDIQATQEEIVAPVGATVTVMVEKLQADHVPIPADQATMMMIGIYEDTGSLTYNSTTVRDFQAAAFLLQQGGNLQLAADVINATLDRAQVSLLNDLLLSSSEVIVRGQRVIIAEASREKYIPEVALIVHRLRDMEKMAVLFALIRMEGKIYLIARSRNQHVNVGQVLEHFGGGGHQSAAAAVTRELTLVQCREQLLAALDAEVEPSLVAADLMTSPVMTVSDNATLADAALLLTKYNINVLPVVVGESKKLCGIITRQVVEKGVFHGLQEVPIREYMTTEFQPVDRSADLLRIQELIVERNQKFLPVVDRENQVIGAITRKDLLRTLHEQVVKEGQLLNGAGEGRLRVKNVTSLLREQFPAAIIEILHQVGDLADEMQLPVFLVGGVVRDLLMRQKNLDIDIVVEGDGIALARAFARLYRCRCHVHATFRTAVIVFPDGFKIDVASTRMEYYDTPASLPKTSESSLKVDLYRRDFTINTMVVSLNRKRFGELRDYFGAFRDLKERTIRVLHNLSFVEDPTRVFRAVRFEQKFGFAIGRQTEHLIANAIKMGFITKLSGIRIVGELKLICSEANPLPIFRRLHYFDLWSQVFPGIDIEAALEKIVPSVRDVLSWYEYLFLEQKVENWQVYLLAILNGVAADQAAVQVARLNLQQTVAYQFLQAREQGIRAAKQLTKEFHQRRMVSNSLVAGLLKPLPLEVILYVLAGHEQREIQRLISTYITTLQFISPQVTGHDLIAMGLVPGVHFKVILERLRDARLDGQVQDRDDEVALVHRWLADEEIINQEGLVTTGKTPRKPDGTVKAPDSKQAEFE